MWPWAAERTERRRRRVRLVQRYILNPPMKLLVWFGLVPGHVLRLLVCRRPLLPPGDGERITTFAGWRHGDAERRATAYGERDVGTRSTTLRVKGSDDG